MMDAQTSAIFRQYVADGVFTRLAPEAGEQPIYVRLSEGRVVPIRCERMPDGALLIDVDPKPQGIPA